MSEPSEHFRNQLRRGLKPLLIALVLISAVYIYSYSKEKETASLDLCFSDDTAPQSIFSSPVQKSQPELPQILLEQQNSFRATTPPFTINPKTLGALMEGNGFEETEKKGITEYTVEKGDNTWSIAAKFGISLNTLLWANDLQKSSLIKEGQTLVIPPVSGVIHHVKDGDTVGGIAGAYKAEAADIVAFNQLSDAADIYIGDILIVPGGEITAKAPVAVASAQPASVPLGQSYFICPIALPCNITQGLHYYNAIDFSHGKCGEPIYAAAAGEVLKVKLTDSVSPWAFNGAGNHISILHPNGVVTTYGHIASSFVQPGQQVSQGQIIALMGGQPGTPGAGQSTGCHVHFAVSGARNPFAQ